MKAKELAALLQINPDMDVCIKEDIVINCHGDKEADKAIWIAIRAIDTCTENGFIVED